MLVSLRDPGDPMGAHEALCFRQATGLAELGIVHAAVRPLGEAELQADLLLFGGSGAYSVLDPHPWVRDFLAFLLQVVERGVPAWGSCFGFQGLALALGGTVVHDDARTRLGSFQVERTPAAAGDPLFAGLPPRFHAQFGHHDHVIALPSGVRLLCTDAQGRLEALRVEGSNFWAAQFHPELTRDLTLHRLHHYRDLYVRDRYQEIVRSIAEGPDDLASQALLRGIVDLARQRRAAAVGP